MYFIRFLTTSISLITWPHRTRATTCCTMNFLIKFPSTRQAVSGPEPHLPTLRRDRIQLVAAVFHCLRQKPGECGLSRVSINGIGRLIECDAIEQALDIA